MDNNKKHQEKQERIDKYKPKLSFFNLELEDYLYVMRRTGFFLTKKRKCYQIQKVEKTASNS